VRRDDRGRAYGIDAAASMALLLALMPAEVALELIDGIGEGIAAAYLAQPDDDQSATEK
jgi:hypothetical protein